MDSDTINLLKICSIEVSGNILNGLMIERELLLSEKKYKKSRHILEKLRKKYSSSSLTSMQKNANSEQKWPLLNLVRQLLKVENYSMRPIRKADGYEADGKKKYKRYFLIEKIKLEKNQEEEDEVNETDDITNTQSEIAN
tara:strand:+ start:410 stop:829 length:420 start_codon:yes stop_codon:yes gene_type:complete